MPLLYNQFDQLIFFDLNVGTVKPHFSTDGSHEFISSYPDPDQKITLIEKTDLSDVHTYCGAGSIEKQKMFAVGSAYVDDDVDVFWCTDMDEFFHASLKAKVENILDTNKSVRSVDLRHVCFWKNFAYKLCSINSDVMTLYSRICRHVPGSVYSHCEIHNQFPETYFFDEDDEVYYHFAWIGDARVRRKFNHYTEPPTGNPIHRKMYDSYLEKVWNTFSPFNNEICGGELFGYPFMHPNYLGLQMGIKKINSKTLPDYVDYEILLNELESEDNNDTNL